MKLACLLLLSAAACGTPHADVRHVEVDDATLEALLDGIDVDLASETRSRTKTH